MAPLVESFPEERGGVRAYSEIIPEVSFLFGVRAARQGCADTVLQMLK